MRRTVEPASFSLVEVIMAVAVLTVAILALLAVLGQSARLRQVSAETEVAAALIQARLGEVRTASADLGDVAAQEGPFTVTDRRLHNPTGQVQVLTEAEASQALQTDLNRDGVVNAADLYDLDGDGTPGEGAPTTPGDTTTGSLKSAYRRLVPVRVTLEWDSIAGKRRRQVVTTFIYPCGAE